MNREEVISELRRVAALLSKEQVSQNEFRRCGRVSMERVLRVFGTWNKAVIAAGLTPAKPGGREKLKGVTPQNILDKIKRVAALLNTESLGLRDFEKHARFRRWLVYRFFGGWTAGVEAAGLKAREQPRGLPDDALRNEFMRVYSELGKAPSSYEFKVHSKFGVKRYENRFGSWANTLKHYLGIDRTRSRSATALVGSELEKRGRLFGQPLNFRELRHEPVNEQGVVFLFGMVARELGFLVDAVGTGFPDCRAKRRAKGGYYVEVDIEFEFKSSNFREHGHDPQECNLIVCWEHDWVDCPVEVLELKSAIRQLDANV